MKKTKLNTEALDNIIRLKGAVQELKNLLREKEAHLDGWAKEFVSAIDALEEDEAGESIPDQFVYKGYLVTKETDSYEENPRDWFSVKPVITLSND